jgi:hypothetical protein
VRKPSSWRRPFRVGRAKTGLGLFAIKAIKKGSLIGYYRGRKVTTAQADEIANRYLFEINSRWTIDGSNRRNLARYINHSCRPNAETDIRGHTIQIIALRSIAAGDEITYNYGRSYFNAFIKPKGCRCAVCATKQHRVRSPRATSRRS